MEKKEAEAEKERKIRTEENLNMKIKTFKEDPKRKNNEEKGDIEG